MEKIARLRELAAQLDLLDLIIEMPGLSEIYAYYTGGEGA